MGKMWEFTIFVALLMVALFGTLSYMDYRAGKEVIIASERYRPAQLAIYENVVVWTEDGKGIFGYDFSTKKISKITSGGRCYAFPAIHGEIIVWQDCRNGFHNRDIYGYNLKTKQEF